MPVSYTNTDSFGITYGKSDSYSTADSNADGKPNSNGDGERYGIANGKRYGIAYSIADGVTNG